MVDRFKYQRQREMESHMSKLNERQRMLASLDPIVREHIIIGIALRHLHIKEEIKDRLALTYEDQSKAIRESPELMTDLTRWNEYEYPDKKLP